MTVAIVLAILIALSGGKYAIETKLEEVSAQGQEFVRNTPDRLRVFESNGKSVRYAFSGDPTQTPLIFVHGSPGGWDAFSRFLLDDSLAKDFFVISVDRPGYGGTQPGLAETSLEKQAEAVWSAFLDARRLYPELTKRPVLIGHSYGGPVIAKLAVQRSAELSGLVFVAASMDPSLEDRKFIQNFAEWYLTRWFVPKLLRVCNQEISGLKSELEIMKPELGLIQTPSIVIQGGADTLVSPLNADYLKRNLSSQPIEFVTTQEMNHFVPWEHPELIEAAVRKISELTK